MSSKRLPVENLQLFTKMLLLFKENSSRKLDGLTRENIPSSLFKAMMRLRGSGYFQPSTVNRLYWTAEEPLLQVLQHDERIVKDFAHYVLRPHDFPKPHILDVPDVLGDEQYKKKNRERALKAPPKVKMVKGYAAATDLTGLSQRQIYDLQSQGALTSNVDMYGNPMFSEEELKQIAPQPLKESTTTANGLEEDEDEAPIQQQSMDEVLVGLLLDMNKRQEQMFERVEAIYQMIVAVAGPPPPTQTRVGGNNDVER